MKRKLVFQCIIVLLIVSFLFTNISYNSVKGRVEINLRKNLISVGQFVGYKALTSISKIKLHLHKLSGSHSLVDTSWDGQSSYVFQALLKRWPKHLTCNGSNMINFSDMRSNKSLAAFIVDIGAHDGIWLSNSHYFLQAGFGGLLVEPNPGTFSELKRTWPDSEIINSSKVLSFTSHQNKKVLQNSPKTTGCRNYVQPGTQKMVKSDIYIVEAAFGFNRSKGNIFDNSILLDATQSRVAESNTGNINIIPLPTLLEYVKVPKHFSVLSIDIEWESHNYVKVVRDVISKGWNPEFLILELRGNLDARSSLTKLGYEYLKTMRYDDIFSRIY